MLLTVTRLLRRFTPAMTVENLLRAISEATSSLIAGLRYE